MEQGSQKSSGHGGYYAQYGIADRQAADVTQGVDGQFSLTVFDLAAEIGNGNRDQWINAGGQIKRYSAGKDAQEGPDHGPAFKGPGLRGLRGHLRQAGRAALNRQASSVPPGITHGIAVYIRVTKLHGHPGRRVAADSSQPRSVKHNETILIISQQLLEFTFFAPTRQPGRFHGKTDGAFYMPAAVFPFLAGVHQHQPVWP